MSGASCAPSRHGAFVCGDGLGQSLPTGSRGLLKAQRSHNLFFLNNSVYSFILAVPSLDYHGGFSPALGRGLLLAAASPAAETGSGRRGRQELRLRALPARQSWCAALAAPACGGFLVRTCLLRWQADSLPLRPARGHTLPTSASFAGPKDC